MKSETDNAIEYKVIDTHASMKEMENLLNELADAHWRVVGVDPYRIYLERWYNKEARQLLTEQREAADKAREERILR